MTFWTFLKSVPGKITMVATTAVAGIAANFVGAESIQSGMKEDIIRSELNGFESLVTSTWSSAVCWDAVNDLELIVDIINRGGNCGRSSELY